MNYHKRWLCNECKREWHDVTQTNANGGQYMNSAPVTITGNPLDGNNCPFCGSPEINEIIYKPRLPGLDIPRNGEYTVLPRRKEIASISTLVGTQRVSIREELPKGFVPKIVEDKTPMPLQIDKPNTPLALATAAEIEQPEFTPTIPVELTDKTTIEENTESSIYDLSDMD